MITSEIINGAAAVIETCNGYNHIAGEVLNFQGFEHAGCTVLEAICDNNSGFENLSELEKGTCIGRISSHLKCSDSMLAVLKNHIPELIQEDSLCFNLTIDCEKPFSVLLTIEDDYGIAQNVMEALLIDSLTNDKKKCIRCADFASGGTFFLPVQRFISMFPTQTGGMVYTKRNDLGDLLKLLEKQSGDVMSKLGKYRSVEEYNKNNSVKVNSYLTVLVLDDSSYSRDEINRLRILVENGKHCGLSFVIAGPENVTSDLNETVDCSIRCYENHAHLERLEELAFEPVKVQNMDIKLESLIEEVQSGHMVDTYYAHHPEFHNDFFTMDSADAIRIPFAIDGDGLPVYFEVGGNAPAHALMAGSTGSGKSVALHTIITQIIHNYHPDDVEIWAIDYKAVEFATYFENRTPHFRVVAHDTSSEFSLGLIDLLYAEYEKRQKAFVEAKVSSINAYRRKFGPHSLPRILVIIDEFQLLTQAVQEYTGDINYKVRFENLLRLTRALGISFILCSQTIASGLSGLTDAARDQIGCRLCLKHEDEAEVRETLTLSGPDTQAMVTMAKNFKPGQGIYKRARWIDEYSPDGKGFEFKQVNILYMTVDERNEIIAKANEKLGNDYTPKEVFLIRGNGRIKVSEKERHPMMKFLAGQYEPDEEGVSCFVAAPVSLKDYYQI